MTEDRQLMRMSVTVIYLYFKLRVLHISEL